MLFGCGCAEASCRHGVGPAVYASLGFFPPNCPLSVSVTTLTRTACVVVCAYACACVCMCVCVCRLFSRCCRERIGCLSAGDGKGVPAVPSRDENASREGPFRRARAFIG